MRPTPELATSATVEPSTPSERGPGSPRDAAPGPERHRFALEGALGDCAALRFDGTFETGWVGRLASGLAARHISIVRGTAESGRGGHWTGRFELRRLEGGPELASVDYAALTREQRPVNRLAPLRLLEYRVRAGEDGLSVHLRADDEEGFLERVLLGFAFSALFPCAMVIETRRGRIDDYFRLQSMSRAAPSENAVELLDEWLAEAVARRTSAAGDEGPSRSPPP